MTLPVVGLPVVKSFQQGLVKLFSASGVTSLATTVVALVLSTVGLSIFAEGSRADTILRIMAANTTSGNRQSYDPGEGTRIFQGLSPDIVLIQEFNIGNNSEAEIAEWVETTFGSEFYYYRERGAQIPNGVISRYPIISSGEWNDSQVSNRDFAWAQIDIPGEQDLWAVSVHFLTRSGSVRNTEANAVRRLVLENIPEGDYLVVGGDLNTRNAGEAALRTLDRVVETDPPHPADQAGRIGTNASRRRPYDWVFADEDLDPLEIPVAIGENSFPHGLVFDSRVYTPLADVAPVMVGDSGATNMQHMAVIRDFQLPESGADDFAEDDFKYGDSDLAEEGLAGQSLADAPINNAVGLVSCRPIVGYAEAGEFQHYAIDIPAEASQLEVNLAGIAEAGQDGDVDVYIRQDEPATIDDYDFRPWLNSSEEQVVVNDRTSPALSPGRWYISVNGYIPETYSLTVAVDRCRAPE
ncbi:MAG: pre-peptidase C-terminal domain-containing protein [Cyanobacteria bacterium J06643_4]